MLIPFASISVRCFSNTIDGGAGTDSIVLTGIVCDGGLIFTHGEGADTIFFQSAGAGDGLSGSTIRGQQGDDSIRLQAAIAGATSLLLSMATRVMTPSLFRKELLLVQQVPTA